MKKAHKKAKIDVSAMLQECIDNHENLSLTPQKSEVINEEPISIESFHQTLMDISRSISANSRMHFWKNESGSHKWASNPEQIGKHFLITALEVKYGTGAIDIVQENIAGAGIIDLYITLRGGLKIVVELKICGGGGYSSSYALSGENQLIHYLKNKGTHVGFLVVFDGRKRDYGKGFRPIQVIETNTIYTIAIDMTPTVEK